MIIVPGIDESEPEPDHRTAGVVTLRLGEWYEFDVEMCDSGGIIVVVVVVVGGVVGVKMVVGVVIIVVVVVVVDLLNY